MPASQGSSAAQSRQQRIEAVMQQLRPQVEQAVRQLVERAVDVPEAEEFGVIDLAFRDAGQKLANQIRQASVASRKKRAT
jgi:predicted O-methyltransferase YrrM